MKKFFCLLLLFSLGCCGGTNKNTDKQSTVNFIGREFYFKDKKYKIIDVRNPITPEEIEACCITYQHFHLQIKEIKFKMVTIKNDEEILTIPLKTDLLQ